MAEKKACSLKEIAVTVDIEIVKTKTKKATRAAALGPFGSTALRHSHANLTAHIASHKRPKPRNRNGSRQRLQTRPTSPNPRDNHTTRCLSCPLLRFP